MSFLKNSEIKLLQKHIKSVNSAVRRGIAKNLDVVSDMVNDLIYDFSTPSGYFSTSAKRIRGMGKREVERFISTIDTVHDMLTTKELISSLNKPDYKPKDLWYAVDYAAKQGTIPPSDVVKGLVDELTENKNDKLFREAFQNILEVGSGNMGVSDFYDKYEALL
jgi:hypothetical protein